MLDDAHDDTNETFTLTLSAPSGGHAYLVDAEATGTIENGDPLPQAWLARFGRTVATHVTDAVGERLRDDAGARLPRDGRRLPAAPEAAPGGE